MRKYKRQIAKAHLRAVGVGNVNRKMSKEKGGVKVWRLALADSIAHNRRNVRKPRRKMRRLAQGAT
jgi:hypothetical protein